MKFSFSIILFSLLIIPSASFSQIDLSKILSGKKANSGITENEAGQGIKEALSQGVTSAVLNLNKTDGFFGSEFYKMQKKWRIHFEVLVWAPRWIKPFFPLTGAPKMRLGSPNPFSWMRSNK
jgi:hypothetical protein